MNEEALDKLMSGFIFQRLKTAYPNYPINDYMADLSRRIWSYPVNGVSLTQLEKVLQLRYIRKLIKLAKSTVLQEGAGSSKLKQSDEWITENAMMKNCSATIDLIDNVVAIAARDELRSAEQVIKIRKEGEDRVHYERLYHLLDLTNLN